MADRRMGVYSRDWMLVDDGSVTVDGIKLGDIGWYLSGPPTIDSVEFQTSYTEVTGVHGSYDLSPTDSLGMAYAGRRKVTLPLRTVGTYMEACRSKVELGRLLGREVEVSWRILPGAIRGRCSAPNPNEVWVGGVFSCYEVELAVDAMPMLYGTEVSASGAAFSVDGNCPTFPRFECQLSSSKELKITAPDGRFIDIPAAGDKGMGGKLVIETSPTKGRAAYLNGNLTPITLDSDFFDLAPGDVTLSVTGAASIKTVYEPMWLIP